VESETEQAKEASPTFTPTFTDAVLGEARRAGWVRRLGAWPAERRVAVAVALLGAVLYVPFLGAVGLWDPWETHYGEVARSMIARGDYIYPWWESSWFFSKPPFTMWLQALGMLLVGAMREPGRMGLYTEWGMRLPFALLSITALVLLAVALSRVVSRRVGLAAAFALATMPLWALLTRQTVTDTPFVASLTCAMACALVGQLDPGTRNRSGWWYAFYAFTGVSVLSKGLLGFLPGPILGLYVLLAVMPYDAPSLAAHGRWLLEPAFRREVAGGRAPMPALWAQFSRMRLLTGLGVFLAVAGPWYLLLDVFGGVDDEGKVFWYRFWIHDHFNRLAAGVHTTTPGGTFVYFIEQGGYALFPWVAAVPGALVVASRLRVRGGDRTDHAALIALLWALLAFFLVSASATKFHHYVFPVLPAVAILVGLFVDRVWEEGLGRHAVPLLVGLVAFVLVGKDLAANPKAFADLYVYNYDRPYPTELLTRPVALVAGRPLVAGDLLGAGLLLVGLYLLVEALRGGTPGRRALAVAVAGSGAGLLVSTFNRGAVPSLLGAGVALAAAGVLLGAEAARARREERGGLLGTGLALLAVGLALAFALAGKPPAADRLRGLVADVVSVKSLLGFVVAGAGVLAVLGALQRSRVAVFSVGWAFAAGLALWLGWGHWVDLSHHWTQRDLFWRYYRQARAGEPITAFYMNWRGETFYSRNTVRQIKDQAQMKRYADQPGREWALVEHARLNLLRSAVGAEHALTLVDRDVNNKFILVAID
jgi:4-amino-4-deoxy-L-arabinose transferase-like glycosyltransferase